MLVDKPNEMRSEKTKIEIQRRTSTMSSVISLHGDQTRICRSLPPVYSSCNSVLISQKIADRMKLFGKAVFYRKAFFSGS